MYNNSVGVSSCIGGDREDWLEISRIAVETENPYSSDALYGIYLDDFKDTSLNSGLISSMLVTGFVNGLYLADDITGQIEVSMSSFGFDGNTDASRTMIRMENNSSAEVTIGLTGGSNCFEATTQTNGHINGADEAGENSSCGYNDFNGQSAGSGTQRVNPSLNSSDNFSCVPVSNLDGCEI